MKVTGRRKVSRETRFTLGEIEGILSRRSGIGQRQAKAFDILMAAIKNGPLGQGLTKRQRAEVEEEVEERVVECVIACIEGRGPVGYWQSDIWDRIQRALNDVGYHRIKAKKKE